MTGRIVSMQAPYNVDGILMDQGGVESGRTVERVKKGAGNCEIRKWRCSMPLTKTYARLAQW